MQDITITLVQADLVWKDKEANLRKFAETFRQITNATDLVVLPEMFSTGFVTDPGPHAEPMQGPTVHWLKEQSALLQAAIVCSLIIKEGERYLNRLIWMFPDGEYVYYDKRHLFTYAHEHLRFGRGSEPLVVHYKGWYFRPLICYDLRFPVWSRNQCIDGRYQYDCLIYVANWPETRRSAWSALLAGRAIENMSYVAGVNRVGKDGKGLIYPGDSAIYSHYGDALVAAEPFTETIVSATLSCNDLVRYREQFDFGRDWDRFQILIND